MKIQLVSDTHNNTHELVINPNVDLVIHAGDISNSIDDLNLQSRLLDTKCKEAGVDYLLVLGNHDYYSKSFPRPYTDAYSEVYDKSKLLTKDTGPKEINGIIFVGATLWTQSKEWYLEKYINDFNYIYDEEYNLISLNLMNNWFEEDWKYIQQYRNKDNVFVITHFPPSNTLCHNKFKGNLLNPYFLNDLDIKGFKNWVCGHTHHTMTTQDNDCNLYLNAFGYKTPVYTECPDFNHNFIIEV